MFIYQHSTPFSKQISRNISDKSGKIIIKMLKGWLNMSIENPSREEIGSILKKAKRIAVVGLSDKPDRTSYMVSKAMKDAGYEIIPVNPQLMKSLV